MIWEIGYWVNVNIDAEEMRLTSGRSVINAGFGKSKDFATE